ncbi:MULTISPECIES: DNA polymerase I [unclassified Roseitalea]|uniref:DNA polymerase I n=1 Tax=unclassified Roseitalea TaxID=2639107 RepID=UPI00273E5D10|nr:MULTISPECIES: DNA polymerase I [unclassified Roseitalea]
MKKGDHLFLVDGSAYIFRAFHALPPLTRKSDGLPVGAVAGFCNMIWKLLVDARDTDVGVTPTHLAVIFDHSAKTFRNTLYADYKANRTEPPEDLIPQFGLIRQATRAFGLPCIEMQGYEADDIIAAYCRMAEDIGADTTIVSSDKDLMQLVTDHVSMYDTMKDRQIDRQAVIEKFGVGPEKMIDLQALCGDPTDNVPGVPGIGPKTAAQLLAEYGDLETLLASAGRIKQKKRRENLIEFADQARLSRELVKLDAHTPVEVPLDEMALDSQDGPKLIAFLKAMEFNTLTRRVAEATGTDAAEIAPAEIEIEWGAAARGPDLDTGAGIGSSGDRLPAGGHKEASPRSASGVNGQKDGSGARGEGEADGTAGQEGTPSALANARAEAAATAKFDPDAYVCIRDLGTLDRWLDMARQAGTVAFDTETDSLDAMQANLVGFSLCHAEGEAAYVPLAHRDGADDLLGAGGLLADQVPMEEALSRLKTLLEDPSILVVGQNIKYDILVMRRHGVDIACHDDTMLISYVLDAGTNGHGMDALAERWLGHKPIAYKDIAGTGKKALTFDRIALYEATCYAAEDADITLRLWRVLKPRLVAQGLAAVYERLERPMVNVLARMEAYGISVDRQILSRLSGEFAQKAAAIEAEIHELAGESFNIGSPRQLGEILFGKMGLPGGTKTRTGQWATSARVLEDLAAEGHELPRRIVDWRQLTKLKSTYTDALPGFIDPRTGRVHTSYSLASTTTGRLSSSEPNLQNIPIRTVEGRRIRTAFVAVPDHKLLSADYSQIELRVLAHVADIGQLKQAFAEGLDIHAMTASEMFGVPIEGMPGEVRRRAKAINFGIIYGISAFGLANQLSIPRSEAGEYIKTYFERFPGIRDYMDATKAFAREHGYVETIFGRRAHYPEIRSSNPQVRAFNERAAINAPIQGSAADIIRRAMIRMQPALEEAGLSARMLLQVHDELIFEVPRDEVGLTAPVVKRIMESAAEPAVAMAVPLAVDANAADDWDEAH